MSLLEKYLEGKEQLHEKFEEIHRKCDEALDMAGGEFLQNFKEMIAAASDEEFHKFMCESSDKLDTVERMAALTARLESYGKRTENEHKTDDEPKRTKGHHIVVVEI